MMPLHYAIDLDRGVHSRTHPTLNMEIYMYVDDPGVYLTAHGDPVKPDLAEAAGFPVAEQVREHEIKTALENAQKQVLEKFGEAQGKIKVVKERGGFRILDIGLGRHNVLTTGGDVLNKEPLTLELAQVLLDNLAPVPEKAPAKK